MTQMGRMEERAAREGSEIFPISFILSIRVICG
jgi:hypothetical protein